MEEDTPACPHRIHRRGLGAFRRDHLRNHGRIVLLASFKRIVNQTKTGDFGADFRAFVDF
jgi:hypothetical protein